MAIVLGGNGIYLGGVYSAAPSVSYLLDTYPAIAAYSLRKLSSTSTLAIRVRRSSDNAEQDIGFDINGDLDTASLLSFVGVNSGTVTTWYNQGTGGSSYNATQTNGSTQPLVAISGALIIVGGKPSVQFTTRSLDINALASYFSGTIKNISSFIVSKHNSTADAVSFSFGSNTSEVPFYILSRNSVNFRLHIRANDNTSLNIGTVAATTNQFLASSLNRASDKFAEYRYNGVSNATGTGTYLTSTPITLNVGSIGSLKRSAQSLYTSGQIHEAIIYDTFEDSNKTNIELDILNYYGL